MSQKQDDRNTGNSKPNAEPNGEVLVVDGEVNIVPEPLQQMVEEIEELDESDKKIVVSQLISSSFAGPLPPPEVFGGYEKVLPGAADRLLKMAENEADRRYQLNIKEAEAEHEQQKTAARIYEKGEQRGQWFAFALAIGYFVLLAIFAILNYVVESRLLGAGSLVIIIGYFLKAGLFGQKRKPSAPDDDKDLDDTK